MRKSRREENQNVCKDRCPTCGMQVVYTEDPPETCPHCKITLLRQKRVAVLGIPVLGIPIPQGLLYKNVWEHVFDSSDN